MAEYPNPPVLSSPPADGDVAIYHADSNTWRPGPPGGTSVQTNWLLGMADGAIGASADGEQWTFRDFAPIGIGVHIAALGYNGTYFLASTSSSSDQKSLYKSTDGEVWTAVPTPVATLNTICWNGTKWVVGTNDGDVLTSPDGTTWTLHATTFSGGGTIETITWNGSIFVAVGQDAAATVAIMSSPDGVTWTARSSTHDTHFLTGLTTSGALFVAVGDNVTGSPVETSPDGITWTARATVSGALSGAIWTGSVFIATASAASWTSPDGITWTQAGTISASGQILDFDGTTVVLVNGGSNFTTDEGTAWTNGLNPGLSTAGCVVSKHRPHAIPAIP